MKARVTFNEKQPDYRYMPIGNNKADVFIYKFIEEVKTKDEMNEEVEQTSFIYDLNEFRVNTDEIIEENIKENPLDYLDYSNEIENIAMEERVSAIEDAIVELAGVIFND